MTKTKEALGRSVPPGEIGVFAKRWGDLVPCEKALAKAGLPYRMVRARDYKLTPLTTWVEDMTLWCAGGWRSGKPRMRDIFAAWERLASACRASPIGNGQLARRVMLYETLSELREPAITVAAWVQRVDASLGLGSLARALDAVPVRMRYELRELSAMLASLSTGAVAGQTLAEFAGLDREKVVLQSLHSSKGLEYTMVFMLGLEEGIIPQYKEDPRDARRLFYVGMTRARREVHLLWSGFFVNAKGKRSELGHSPFLPELYKRLNPKSE